jgi:hypothetical protein
MKHTVDISGTFLIHLLALLKEDLGSRRFRTKEKAIVCCLFKHLSNKTDPSKAFSTLYKHFGTNPERMDTELARITKAISQVQSGVSVNT